MGTALYLFDKLIERARHEPSSQAVSLLARARDLVEGVPFDDANFDWAHDRQHHARACQLIEDATLRLVHLALDDGDVDMAREARRRGLIGLPLNEPIYCARMRVEAAAGNRSGIESAFRDLRAGLNDLGNPHRHLRAVSGDGQALRATHGLDQAPFNGVGRRRRHS